MKQSRQERNGLIRASSTSSWWQCWVRTRKKFLLALILEMYLGGMALFCFVKNGEGGTKYQEGWKTRPTSRMESCKLVLSETYLGLMEHKPRWVGPCLARSLPVRLLYSILSGERPGTSRSILLRTRIAYKRTAWNQLVEASFIIIIWLNILKVLYRSAGDNRN